MFFKTAERVENSNEALEEVEDNDPGETGSSE